MAINTVAQRQGEAASTLPREQVIECLAELEERSYRFVEIPEALQSFDGVLNIRGAVHCPKEIEKAVDEFESWGMPLLLGFITDGIRHRLHELHAAQAGARKTLGITHEEILAIRHEIEEE